MPTITSAGLGSGLDISSLVESLVAAEREPAVATFDQRQGALDAKISAYGELSSALSSYQNDLGTLKTASTFNGRTITSSNESVLSATVSSLADPGANSIVVNELAQQHTLVTTQGLFSSQDDVLGAGTLTIRYGTTDHDPDLDTYSSFVQDTSKASDVITIDSSNNTLSTFRDYINDGDYGFTASIVNDGSSFRLLMAANTGGNSNSMEIVVDDTDDSVNNDAVGLSRLAFNSSATQMEQTLDAKSANLSVNGLEVLRDTNTIDDIINGVTLDIKQAAPASTVSLSIVQDSGGIKDKITSFVDSFNGLFEKISELTARQTDIDEDGVDDGPGILLGDSFTRNIQFQLRRITGDSVDGLTGAVTSLADLGITTNYNVAGQSDGTLGVNTATLDNALANNLDQVSALFAPQGSANTNGVDWVSSNSLTQSGSYDVEVTSLATKGAIEGSSVLNSFPLTVTDTMDDFIVRVDGQLSGSLQLTTGDYASGAELAAEYQAQINSDSNFLEKGLSVSVVFDTDKLVVTSSNYGSNSSVAFTSVDDDTEATIGIGGTSGTIGQNVVGTINGQTANGDGQFLLSAAGDSNGLKLLISSTSTGSLGSVVFSRGIATEIDEVVERLIGLSGTLPDQISGLQDSLTNISVERETLDFRMDKLEARLQQQFSVMDRLVANLQSTSSFLTQQFSALSGDN